MCFIDWLIPGLVNDIVHQPYRPDKVGFPFSAGYGSNSFSVWGYVPKGSVSYLQSNHVVRYKNVQNTDFESFFNKHISLKWQLTPGRLLLAHSPTSWINTTCSQLMQRSLAPCVTITSHTLLQFHCRRRFIFVSDEEYLSAGNCFHDDMFVGIAWQPTGHAQERGSLQVLRSEPRQRSAVYLQRFVSHWRALEKKFRLHWNEQGTR